MKEWEDKKEIKNLSVEIIQKTHAKILLQMTLQIGKTYSLKKYNLQSKNISFMNIILISSTIELEGIKKESDIFSMSLYRITWKN
jgi:hypothetical protein